MRRRSLIQSLIALLPFQGMRAWAQTAIFPDKHETTLKRLAATVLPESLGIHGTDAVAEQFIRWVREYRPGAEMQSGYGFTRVRFKPASPAPKYLEQLDELAAGALAQSGLNAKRKRIAEILEAAKVRELPFAPDGAHIAADLMSFYFQSSEANDLAYGASIGKDKCRTLDDSSAIPASLKQGSRSGAI